MKKTGMKLCSVLLCMCLLCSCSAVGVAAFSEEEIVPFSEMEYVRPDTDALAAAVEEAIAALENNTVYYRLRRYLDRCMDNYSEYATMYVLADIHSCMDMTDEFWAEEYSWCMENDAEISQLYDDLYYACAASRRAERIERDYFWEGFCEEYSDPEETIFTDEYVRLLREEAGLMSEYHSIIAAPIIEMDGKEVDFYSYLDECGGGDYVYALIRYYSTYNEELSDIYIKLIRVRQAIARQLGYESCREMQYDSFFMRDYTPEEAEAYIADIKQYMVPLYRQLSEEYSPLTFSERKLKKILASAAGKMSEDTAEVYKFMSDYELLSLNESSRKAEMSFTTYIDKYSAPFLFMNPAGDSTDLLTLFHEFGHAVDGYENYNAEGCMDLLECFSQSMEYLLLFYAQDALDEEELDGMMRMKIYDTLESYIQQASFAEFENRVYAMSEEELSAESLNAISLELSKEYGYYYMGLDDYYAMSWMDIVHFFEYPFYVISYPVSCDAAMQIYELERGETGAGVEQFFALLPREYVGIVESLTAAGMESPFAAGRVQKAAEDIKRMLMD